MAIVPESFEGGIVTNRHPSMLRVGELQRATNCVYRKDNPALTTFPAEMTYATLTDAYDSAVVKGFAPLYLPGTEDDAIILRGSDNFYLSPLSSGLNGTFTAIGTSGKLTVTANTTLAPVASCVLSGSVKTVSEPSANAFLNAQVGMYVTGTGVQVDTVIEAKNYSTRQITLSKQPTAGTVTLTFYPVFTCTSSDVIYPDILGTRVFGDTTTVPSGTYICGAGSTTAADDGATTYTAYPKSTNVIFMNWAPANGSYTIAVDGGLAAQLKDEGGETMGALQWDMSLFTWTPQERIWRIARRQRRSATSTPLSPVLSARPAGLKPVTATLTGATCSSPGSWNPTLGTGFYWFVVTEIYSPSSNITTAEKDPSLANEIIESAFLGNDTSGSDPNSGRGRPVWVNITNTSTQGVRLTLPIPANDGTDGYLATHWAIYMGPKTDDQRTIPSLASFRRVKTIPISKYTTTVTADLIDANTTQGWNYIGATPTGFAGRNSFANPANMVGPPGANWSGGWTGGGANPGSNYVWNAASACTSFGFTDNSLVPVGIEVMVQCAMNSAGEAGTSPTFTLQLGAGGTTWSPVYARTVTSPTQRGEYFGGPTDMMGLQAAGGTLPSAANLINLVAYIAMGGSGGQQRLEIDAVGIRVYYSGNTINYDGPAYRTVTYRDQVGTTVTDPANFLPPNCSCGASFQGSFVYAPVGEEGVLRYSLPNRPEANPYPYRLKPASSSRESITAMHTLGQMLIAGFTQSVYRINYLPRETDTDFLDSNVRAAEQLTNDHGVVGPFAITSLNLAGSGTILPYVSQSGLMYTDGLTCNRLNVDLAWLELIEPAYLHRAQLLVYPREEWLVLHYTPAGQTTNTRTMVFPYGKRHIKADGTLPAVGPIERAYVDMVGGVVRMDGTTYLLTADDTTIVIEDGGAGTLPVDILSREMMIAGRDRDAHVTKAIVDYGTRGMSDTTTVSYTKGSTAVRFTSWAVANSANYDGTVGPVVLESSALSGRTRLTSLIATTGTYAATIETPARATGSFSTRISSGGVKLTAWAGGHETALTSYATTYLDTTKGNDASVILESTQNKHAFGFTTDGGAEVSILGLHLQVTDAGEETLRGN